MNNYLEQLQIQAQAFDVDAINELALIYSDEHQSLFDEKKAIELLNQGLTLGSGLSAYYLGVGYMNGVYGLNIDKAKSYFELAIDLGFEGAYYALARLMLEELDQFDDAIDYLERGVDAGDIKSARYLANLYLEGQVIEQNITRAKSYLELLIKQNHPLAMYDLATILINPNFSESLDYHQAYQYATQGCQLGNVECLMLRAYLNASGLLGTQDIEEAYKDIKKASILVKLKNDPLITEQVLSELEDIEKKVDPIRLPILNQELLDYFNEILKQSSKQ